MPTLAVEPLFLNQLKSALGSAVKPQKPCSKSHEAKTEYNEFDELGYNIFFYVFCLPLPINEIVL